jgi:biopolymer transport protein ExbB
MSSIQIFPKRILIISAAAFAIAAASPVVAQTQTGTPSSSTQVEAKAETKNEAKVELKAGVAASNNPTSNGLKATPPTTDNPYGLKAMIDHGDLVSKGVLALLLIMSLGTWYVVATKLLEQRKVLKEAKNLRSEGAFWSAGTLEKGVESLSPEGAFCYLAQAGLNASKHHKGMLETLDLGTWVTASLDEAGEDVEHRMQKGLSFLATVGATSPFIGLFGTVWGILNALTAIGVAGQASIDKVAGPVGEALIMTALGLAVAVPAVLGYNWLVGRNATALHQINTFGSKLRAALLLAPARV